jgi:hypothetical protein
MKRAGSVAAEDRPERRKDSSDAVILRHRDRTSPRNRRRLALVSAMDESPAPGRWKRLGDVVMGATS